MHCWSLVPQRTKLMRRITLTSGISGLALCLAGAAGAVTEDQFGLRNTGDLAALCSASATDPLYTAALNFCHGFGAGTYGVWLKCSRLTLSSDYSVRRRALPAMRQ